MVAGAGKLGNDFWGQWYRVDDEEHSIDKLRATVSELGLQACLEQDGTTITMARLRENLLQIKTQLRAAGFRMPTPKDKKVVSVWDPLGSPRGCNSTHLQTHIVKLANCPDSIKSKYVSNVAHSREAEKRMGKRALDEVREAAEDAASTELSGKKARSAGDVRSYSERILTESEVRDVDERLARFCFSEGLPFKALSNAELRAALGKLNKSWAEKTRLSDWTLRHHFLDDEYGRVAGKVAEKITAAHYVCLISDGWSGVQKRHVLNLILATPEPVFMGNIETGEDAVTGEYQAELFSTTIQANGGMAKVPAICTDNASVMRKCWRLLREKFHGLFTYGCAPHGFQLHAQDICTITNPNPSPSPNPNPNPTRTRTRTLTLTPTPTQP